MHLNGLNGSEGLCGGRKEENMDSRGTPRRIHLRERRAGGFKEGN
jgi:hypothetical protein